jgi:Holliday junction resolvase RusA-like endonuclease
MIRFTIPGPPVGKGRARSTRNGHHYTPEKTREYEKLVRGFGHHATDGLELIERPVRLSLMFYLPIPKSWSKKDRLQAQDGKVHHTGKPDLDNLIKSVSDGLNGVIYVDDSQIKAIDAMKVYDINPRVEVEIEEL